MLSKASKRFSGSLKDAAKTALYDFHVENGGKMVSFADWALPVYYKSLSIVESHIHTRLKSSLFDVSHMGVYTITGKDRVEFFNRLLVADVEKIKPGEVKLSCFTNKDGGIIDDCMLSNKGDHHYLVVNAGCQPKDHKHMMEQLEIFTQNGDKDVQLHFEPETSLLALQGPLSARVMERLMGKSLTKLKFMHHAKGAVDDIEFEFARCGYTGEDGFEITVREPEKAIKLAEILNQQDEVELAGLGARDSLRLEAGLCLYGNDMDETVTPAEASLLWLVSKKKRTTGGYLGAEKIISQYKDKSLVKVKRVGFELEDGSPVARHEMKVFDKTGKKEIGFVTSGTFSPILKRNIGMCRIDKKYSKIGTEILIKVRRKMYKAKVTRMPFYPNGFYH